MGQGQEGMVPNHPWSGVSHDVAHLRAHGRFVAVHGAGGAGALLVAEGATVEARLGVHEQRGALWA